MSEITPKRLSEARLKQLDEFYCENRSDAGALAVRSLLSHIAALTSELAESKAREQLAKVMAEKKVLLDERNAAIRLSEVCEARLAAESESKRTVCEMVIEQAKQITEKNEQIRVALEWLNKIAMLDRNAVPQSAEYFAFKLQEIATQALVNLDAPGEPKP